MADRYSHRSIDHIPLSTVLILLQPQVGVPVNHCLLALPGVKKGDLKRVMSHPQVGWGPCFGTD